MPESLNLREEIGKRLERLGLAPAREAEIVEELAAHLRDEYELCLARGATEAEARKSTLEGLSDDGLAAALKAIERLPVPSPIVPGTTDRRNFAADLWQDFRYSIRTLKRNPGFTALAVLSLALGIGANAAIFSIVSAVLIQPLPYPQADRLVQAANSGYYRPAGLVDLQQESRTMEVAGFVPGMEQNLTYQRETWRLKGSSVSANFFRVLGAGIDRGRGFQTGEDQPGQDGLVILSQATWKDKFASDPGIIGRVIALGGSERRVIGIAHPGFKFPEADTQFWIPLRLDPRDVSAYWSSGFMPIIGRLRTGATLGQARQEIHTLTQHMLTLFPFPMGRDWNKEATVVPLQQFMVAGVRTKLVLLQCSIGLILLIACVNVANLLLARASSRQKEMALRTALGAARGRIVRQLLTESVTLASAGGALGMALASPIFSMLKLLVPAYTSGLSNVHLGWQTIFFAGGVSLLTGLAFGLAPALTTSKRDLAGAIKSGSQRLGGTARTRLRNALISGEVALAVMLAVSAGLLIKSLWKLVQVDPGFRAEHILTLQVSPDRSLCQERTACIELFNELLRQAKEIPGVDEAAAANTTPLASNIPFVPVVVQDHPVVWGVHQPPLFWAGAITASYFRAMGIPVLSGRAFADSDQENSAPVVIVSASVVHKYWPGENPIGKHLRMALVGRDASGLLDNQWRTVVGVAGDVRQYDLADRSPSYLQGAMYMPYSQSLDGDSQLPSSMALIVRTASDPAPIQDRIRQLARDLNPNVPVSEFRSMESIVRDSTQQSRSMMWIFLAFAGAALLLAAIGTYGLVSYSTEQRRFEIGVRMALGASRRNIFGLVLGQTLRLVLAGLVVGLAVSWILTRMLATFLYGTAITDPMTLCVVCGILIVVGLVAGYAPAQRAADIDPLAALRVD